MHIYTTKPIFLFSNPFLHLTISEYTPDKIFKVKVTTQNQRSNQGHTMIFYTHTSSKHVPNMYELPKPCGLCDKFLTRFSPLTAHPARGCGWETIPPLSKGCGVKTLKFPLIYVPKASLLSMLLQRHYCYLCRYYWYILINTWEYFLLQYT